MHDQQTFARARGNETADNDAQGVGCTNNAEKIGSNFMDLGRLEVMHQVLHMKVAEWEST